MNNVITLISMLMSFLAVTGAFALFPYVSRKTTIFGVSVPEGVYDDPRVARIRKAYIMGVCIAGLLFATGVVLLWYLTGADAAAQGIWLSVLVFVNLFVNGAVYLRAYRGMKRLKAEEDWNKDAPQLVTIDTGFRKKKTMISPLYFIAYLVVIAATAAVSFLRYDALPSMIPVTFDNAGNAVGFMEKSYRLLLNMPGVQLIITMIMLFVYYSISKSRQQVDPANRDVSLTQNVIFRRRWSAFTVFCGLGMVSVFGIIQLSILGILSSSVTVILSLLLPAAIIIYVIVLAVSTGQSGSRVKVDKGDYPPAKAAAVREDDSNWKFGAWYYNPDDPSLFVEKRVGIGWTVNWARPMAWVIILGILALVAGSLIFSFSTGR